MQHACTFEYLLAECLCLKRLGTRALVSLGARIMTAVVLLTVYRQGLGVLRLRTSSQAIRWICQRNRHSRLDWRPSTAEQYRANAGRFRAVNRVASNTLISENRPAGRSSVPAE